LSHCNTSEIAVNAESAVVDLRGDEPRMNL
jgi:hypothetical protein